MDLEVVDRFQFSLLHNSLFEDNDKIINMHVFY